MLYATKQQIVINIMVNALPVTDKSYHKLYLVSERSTNHLKPVQ